MTKTAQSKLSEQEFLRLEAENAKAAVAQSLEHAKQALAKNVDPRSITRQHPWLAMGTAAIAAFTAMALVVPSKEEQELRRLERLSRAMNPDPPAKPAAETNGSAPKPPEKRSLGSTILHELIQLIRPMLMAAITASIKAGANSPPQQPIPPANPENS